MDILDEIIAYKRKEIAERTQFVPIERLYQLVETMEPMNEGSMSKQLMASSSGIIAEFKRKSPSRGWIHKDAKVADVTLGYEQAGATALSILTDSRFFGGYDEFIQQSRAAGVKLPILYKNFVIDIYQLLQAKYCGASAVLLIAACLSHEECAYLIAQAHQLGLEVLLELHDEHELDYAALEPDMIGVNNRHLGSFVTDINQSFLLADRLPKHLCRISESGIHNAQTVRELRQAGFHGFLMGEYFMKSSQPSFALNQFLTELR